MQINSDLVFIVVLEFTEGLKDLKINLFNPNKGNCTEIEEGCQAVRKLIYSLKSFDSIWYASFSCPCFEYSMSSIQIPL